MKRYVVRFSLTTLIGIVVVFPLSVSNISAQDQQKKRAVVKKPWPVEPVSVVAVNTKNKGNIEIGKGFNDNDDWLDGLVVTVANNYDKTVTALTIEMVFRREPGDTRPPFAKDLNFGPHPRTPQYANRDPKKVIKVGKTADLSLSPEMYNSLKRGLERTGYLPNSNQLVEIIIREVGFEDGSMFHTGTFFLQDPAYPNDPTKKIPVPQTPALKT